MRLLDLGIVVLVIGVFVGSMSSYVMEMDDQYNMNLTDIGFESMNRMQDIHNLSVTAQENYQSQTGEIQEEQDTAIQMIRAGYQSTKLFFKSPLIIKDLIADGSNRINQYLGIPQVVFYAMTTFFFMFVTISIIYLVFKIKA